MKKLLPFLLAVITSASLTAQSLTGKHHIKYLEINTVQSDFGTTFLEEDKLVFTTPANDRSKNPQLDLFVGDIGEEGEITNKERVKGLITKTISKNGIAFGLDNKTIYFSAIPYRRRARKNDKHQLFTAVIDSAGNWNDISKLSFNNKKYSYEQPSLSNDGKRLYFVSNMPSSIGGKDIFVVVINEDGSYGDPANLGTTINTSGDEVTPFISDKDILYFSSNGHQESLGNLDIYASEVVGNTMSQPFHLESPVNSINDDFAYIVSSKNDRGYFSSNRLQGQNNNDIYAFTIEELKEEKCLQEITGIVKDKATLELLKNAAITLFDEEGNQVQQVVTDENGVYSLSLDCSNTYTLVASSLYYNKEEHVVNTANYLHAPTLTADKFLSKTGEGVAVELNEDSEENEEEVESLNSIYFDFDRYKIKEDATSELDKIVRIMKENTNLHVEVSSYTDSRGTDHYNLGLSNRRAKATIDYIVSKGIDRDRLKGKGYGESRMLNKCVNGVECSEKAHALNRRTEFAILNPQAYHGSLKRTKNAVVAIIDDKPATKPVKAPLKTPTDKTIANQTNKEGSEKPNLENQVIATSDQTLETEQSNNAVLTQTSNDAGIYISDVSSQDTQKEESNLKTTDVKSELSAKKNKESSDHTTRKVADGIVKNKSSYNKAAQEEKTLVKTVDTQKEAVKTEAQYESRQIAKMIADKEIVVRETNPENNPTHLNSTKSAIKTKLTPDLRKDRIESVKAVDPTESAPKPLIKTKNYTAGQEASNATKEPETNPTKTTPNSSKSLDEFFDSISTESSEDGITPDMFNRDHSHRVNNHSTSMFDNRPKIREYNIPGRIDKNTAIKTTTIDVSAMTIKRSGKHVETGAARNTDAIRINFKMYSNRAITPGNKEVFIVIQNPDGTVINQKGTFTHRTGNEIPYTDETTTFYDNHNLGVSILSDRFIQKFHKGTYIVQIYIERYLTGQTFLILG